MNEYIKKEDVENIMLSSWGESALWKIRYLPPADVVEVRHGHWEQEQPRLYKCSACNKVCFAEMWGDDTVLYDYCPNCGARMDGKEQEHE